MKNIHILPTDKTSRIIKSQDNDFILLNTDAPNWLGINLKTTKQHIYITNDEEIKEDYVIAYEVVIKVMMFDKETLYFVNGTKAKREDCKKIILTTDQDLIKDGVQSIDDEFLEWFVKNPSCEEIKINYEIYKEGVGLLTSDWRMSEDDKYKIIIPKEEPKQETLEEVAERLYPYEVGYGVFDRNCEIDAERQRFIEGVKWQKEQDNNKYSDEDVIELLKTFDEKFNSGIVERNKGINNWFEQFKKK